MRLVVRFPVFVFLALTLCVAPAARAQQVLALQGTVVTPSGPLADATVLIKGTSILAVGRDLELPAGTRIVKTGGAIYPGLIDLHNHVTWNALARWRAGAKSGARYDWQQLPEYRMALDVPHQKMVAEGHGCAAERYAEVKAIVGGATSQAGLNPDDLTMPGPMPGPATASAAAPGCLGGWVRELGVSSRLYPKGTGEELRYEVFPLGLDQARAESLVDGLHSGSINAALFHIAEGAADNASARREFGMLKARGLLVPGVSIIHGVALSPANFADMARAGVGLVWSPHSNFELYGSTADVAGAKAAGVKMAIAPDWSPTGSDGMLQELKYAAVWNATQSPAPFTDRELFEMATANAAQLGGIAPETGTIAAGKRADLLVLSPPTGGEATPTDPYAVLVHASVADVALVVVDGVALYGDAGLMRQVHEGRAAAELKVCGAVKELTEGEAQLWPETVGELTAGLGRWGSGLSALAECH
jgi:cytosine/adenosine deaminase-related metal-dependent hydrolase